MATVPEQISGFLPSTRLRVVALAALVSLASIAVPGDGRGEAIVAERIGLLCAPAAIAIFRPVEAVR